MPRTRIDGLLSLLDIYSPRPAARIAVLLTMAVGAVLLARGAATGSAIGALPFLLLVWANRERFLATVEDLLARHPWLVPGVPLLVCAAKLAMDPPAASDDLLRHIASAFWPGAYADMYVHSALPPVSLYPSFDALAAGLARLVGPLPAMWTLQALACAGFLFVFLAAARRLTAGNPAAGLLVTTAATRAWRVRSPRCSVPTAIARSTSA